MSGIGVGATASTDSELPTDSHRGAADRADPPAAVAIHCDYGSVMTGAHDLVSFMLRSDRDLSEMKGVHGEITVQAFGHMSLDAKWQARHADPSSIFLKQTAVELNGAVPAPPRPHSHSDLASFCVFATPRDKVDLKGLYEGVIVQFSLPMDVFPTCTGMMCNVSYYVALVSTLYGVRSIAYFPFKLSGPGSRELPQYIRFSYLTLYASSCIDASTVFDNMDVGDEEQLYDTTLPMTTRNDEGVPYTTLAKCAWGEESLFGSKEISFSLRTDELGHVCTVAVMRGRVHPGESFNLQLQFSVTRPTCQHVRATLRQKEIRTADGVTLKDRVLETLQFNVRCAIRQTISFPLSPFEVCSFCTPFSEITYVIDFEFDLLKYPEHIKPTDEDVLDLVNVDDLEMDETSDPLRWSLPVRVHPTPYIADSVMSRKKHVSDKLNIRGEPRVVNGLAIYNPDSRATSAMTALNPLDNRSALIALKPLTDES